MTARAFVAAPVHVVVVAAAAAAADDDDDDDTSVGRGAAVSYDVDSVSTAAAA